MRKKSLRVFCSILLCLLLCMPMSVTASAINTDTDCSLTLHYTHEETGLSGLEIAIYRVAEVFEDGTYSLLPAYAKYPVDIQNLSATTAWQDAARTLQAYLTGDKAQPHQTVVTDTTGTAAFTKLPSGLYLVRGTSCETDEGFCRFADAFLFLPYTENGVPTYHIDAKPKYSQFIPHDTEQETDYSVLKLWKDADDPAKRPASIEVSIYRDGTLHKTVTLSAENNWFYTWSSPAGHDWTVTEPTAPKDYTVTLSVKDFDFVLTNTLQPDDDEPDDDKPDDDEPDDDEPDDDKPDNDKPDDDKPDNDKPDDDKPDDDEPDDDEPDDDKPDDDKPDDDKPDDDKPDDDEPDDDKPDDKPNDTPDEDIPQTGDTSPLLLYIVLLAVSGLLCIILGVAAFRGKNHEKKK